jgi:hypothetical protein
VDRHASSPYSRTAPVGDRSTPGAGSLSQSAIRRRRAQRAFEQRVRAMARRFPLPDDDGAGARRPLPQV